MAEKNNETTDHGISALAVKIIEKTQRLKYVILAATALLIVFMIISTQVRRQKTAREAEAENSVFQAEVSLAGNPESDVLAIFGEAAKEYEGLPAGARALVVRFAHAYNTREFAAAEQTIRDFLRVYPRSTLAARAKLALGQTLLVQDKTADAVIIFRELTASADPKILPESKLGLAQALEREAEAVKDDPDEYRRRLEIAEHEYNDIVVRSQISIPIQRGYWPQSVILPADFSLTIIRDKLIGHQHPAPLGSAHASDDAELSTGVMSMPPPPPDDSPAEEEKEETVTEEETGRPEISTEGETKEMEETEEVEKF